MKAIEWVKWIAKALVAGALAFGGLFATAIVDDAIVTGEWVAIIIATLVAVLGVFLVPNGDRPEGG